MTDKPLNQKELLELGKKLQQFYDMGYVNKRQALIFSFLKGVASGLGAIIGGTIVVGLLLWCLSFFNQIPFANRIVNAARHSVSK